jgi:hypothetical protein
MPMNANLLRDLPPKLRTYWTKADQFVTKMGTGWELVEVGTADFAAWVRYFRAQGLKPHMLTMVERKVIDKIAVPARTPEWFDPEYEDHGELLTKAWQDSKTTPALQTIGRAWLDRSDPVAARLIAGTDGVTPVAAMVGQTVDYREFQAHAVATGRAPRPVGAYEPGGYLGASAVNTQSKRKVYTEVEKAAFLESAKKTAKEFDGLKLSEEAKAILRSQDQLREQLSGES